VRASKVKRIRRALREELKASSERWVAHPEIYENTRGQNMLKYRFQYGVTGGKKLVDVAKKLYRLGGILPR
jgi:hypothetical protein